MATINLNYETATSDDLKVILRWLLEIGSFSNVPVVFDNSDNVWAIVDAETREVVTFCGDWDRSLTADSLAGLAELCREDLALCTR